MNRRLFKIAFWCYLALDLFIGGNCGGIFQLTPLLAAQFTTVTGTVVDPNGVAYAQGTITAALILSGTTPTLNGGSFAMSAAAGLDAAGKFTMQLADSNQMVPITQWQFSVCSAGGTVQPAGGTGPQCFITGGITITGASQSISAQLQALAPALTTAGGLCVACAPKASPTFTGTMTMAPTVKWANTTTWNPVSGTLMTINTGSANSLLLQTSATGAKLVLSAGTATLGTSATPPGSPVGIGDNGNGLTIQGAMSCYDTFGTPALGGASCPNLAGLGFPPMRASSVFTGRTTALGTTTVLATTETASYWITANVFCDTTVATATATLTVVYVDSSNTSITTTGTGALCTTLGAASQQVINLPNVRVKTGTNITWAIAIANAPNFDASVFVYQHSVN